jgi:hypothetical protein
MKNIFPKILYNKIGLKNKTFFLFFSNTSKFNLSKNSGLIVTYSKSKFQIFQTLSQPFFHLFIYFVFGIFKKLFAHKFILLVC